MKYVIYDKAKAGRILRIVQCSPGLQKQQVKEGESIIEGDANDVTQKVVDEKVVDKTLEEIEAERSPEISFEEQAAVITNKQWQGVLRKLDMLEKLNE